MDALAKTLQRLQGFSADRIAAVSGLHAQTVRKLRRGEHSPTLRTLTALDCAAAVLKDDAAAVAHDAPAGSP